MLIYRMVPTGVPESGTSMVFVLLPQKGVGVGLLNLPVVSQVGCRRSHCRVLSRR